MCRLFGMSTHARPVTARFWLLDAADSLLAQSHREPDGSGLGWFDAAGAPHVQRATIPAWRDLRFAASAEGVTSTRFVAHLRYASTGSVDPRNAHPFLQAGRLFAHNGVVDDLDVLRAELGPEGLAEVHGETDSELTFALVTREIARRDGDVVAGIAAVGRWIAEHLPVYAWNVVLATPDELHALRWPDVHELWWLDRAAGGHDAGADRFHGEGEVERLAVSSGDLAEHPALIVASEPLDDDPGWRALAPGQLVSADRDGVVRVRDLLDVAPRRVLTVDDLDARAAASQAGAGQAPSSGASPT